MKPMIGRAIKQKVILPGFVMASLALAGPVAGAKSQSLGAITLTEVAPRIVTPNGDSKNDKVFFKFDNDLTGVPLETNVFDVNGAKVANLQLDSLDARFLTWDGR